MVNQSRNKIRVGITAGDPNGIGYEILIKLFSDNRLTDLFVPVIYGSRVALDYYSFQLKDFNSFNPFFIENVDRCSPKRVNFIPVGSSKLNLTPGQSTKEAGMVAIASLKAAVRDIKKGALDVLVTGPIDKNNTYSEEFPFVGHTDYFASEFQCERPLMFMVSDNIKVGLVTMHSALADVPSAITQENILGHIHLIVDSLKKDFTSTNPKIAVLSLNPHCGDGGVIGNEEKEIIMPALEVAEQEDIIVKGPFSSDGFFGSGMYKNFDAVLAMYHDQGLAPFKSLAIDGGVNFTAGLPVVRTSPAHGVGYDIVGTGKADISSFRSAIFMAIDIFRNRTMNEELSSNPLKFIRKKVNDKVHNEKNVDEMLPEQSED